MMTIETHGDVLADYDKMGAPVYLGEEQLRQLRDVERLEAPLAEPPYGGPFTLECRRRDWQWLW